MQRVAVNVGIHRDRCDAHSATGRHDTHGNFPAIGDEYFFEHLT
jgi:hypothetical protein